MYQKREDSEALSLSRKYGIRTHDLFVPNEARYQTALISDALSATFIVPHAWVKYHHFQAMLFLAAEGNKWLFMFGILRNATVFYHYSRICLEKENMRVYYQITEVY